MDSLRTAAIILITLLAAPANSAGQTQNPPVEMETALTEQLQRLSVQHGFTVRGIEKIRGPRLPPAGNGLAQQIKNLLQNFNYLITQDERGKIQVLTILGPKPVTAGRIVLPTQKRGQQHSIEVRISGDGITWQTLSLVVDTGADLVVLAASMIETLGLDSASLQEKQVQTANGPVRAKTGVLAGMEIGPERLHTIEVAFIPDDRLGGNQLLGMNVLGRYRMTLDDPPGGITLIRSRW